MNSDAQSVIERLDAIEARLRKIEEEVVKGRRVIVIDETHLSSMKEAVGGFLDLSDRFKGDGEKL